MQIVMPVYGTPDEETGLRPIIRAVRDSPGFRVVPGGIGSLFDRGSPADPGSLMDAERPSLVLVHGGTSTALAAAFAAAERGIPVAHVGAGRCGGDIADALPHEPVRRILGRMAQLHLAPTEHAKRILLAAAVPEERIVVTGGTLVDAAKAAVEEESPASERVTGDGRPIVLVVAHQRENVGIPMQRVGDAVRVLAARFPDHAFVIAAGPELAVHAGLAASARRASNIRTAPIVPFAGMVRLLSRATLVLTDCGEIEEVAPGLGVPVLVLGATTERPEGVLAGSCRMVGTNVESIVEESSALLSDPLRSAAMANAADPFGDGRAAERTVAALSALLGRGERLPDFAPSAALAGAR